MRQSRSPCGCDADADRTGRPGWPPDARAARVWRRRHCSCRDSRERGVPSGHSATRHWDAARCPAPRLGSNLSAGYPLSVAEPVAQGPLAGPPGPAWPARTALCRNHFHLKSGRSPVRSRPWPPDTRRSAAVWWGWPAQAITSIRQNPPQVDRPLSVRKVGAGTAPHPTCRPSGRTRIG